MQRAPGTLGVPGARGRSARCSYETASDIPEDRSSWPVTTTLDTKSPGRAPSTDGAHTVQGMGWYQERTGASHGKGRDRTDGVSALGTPLL